MRRFAAREIPTVRIINAAARNRHSPDWTDDMRMVDAVPMNDTSTQIYAAAALHHSLFTLDTHVDFPWPNPQPPSQDTNRCVDFAKMRAGGVSATVFVAYVQQGPHNAAGHAAAGAQVEAMLRTIHAFAAGATAIPARVAATVAELDANHKAGVLSLVPAVENGYGMGEDLSRLALWRSLGARYLTITHNGHNLLADAAIPLPALGDGEILHGGLSDLGVAAIDELNRLGMLVDVSHASKQSMLQAAEISRTPVVATHSCMRSLCNHPRNLDDAQLDVIRDVGGVVQVTSVPGFLKQGAQVEDVDVAIFVDHIDYAVRRIGIEHVGIGSDFDGGGHVQGWMSTADSPAITAELLKRGYDRDAITAIWGGNFLRVMKQAEEKAEVR